MIVTWEQGPSDGAYLPNATPPVIASWLPHVGPSGMFALQMLYDQVVRTGATIEVTPLDLGLALGVNPSRAEQAVDRLTRFGLCRWEAGTLMVPALVPVRHEWRAAS